MSTLIPVNDLSDILPIYRGTAIEKLLRYHNLGEPLPPSTGHAEILVGMCMDNRKKLRRPPEFAYVIRAAGGNLRGSEFEVSYAVSVARVPAIALLAHTDCGMAHVTEKREIFIRGLVEFAGWNEKNALRHFEKWAADYEIGDPVEFAATEAARIKSDYPNLLVAPLLYTVEDDRLTQITN